MNTDTVRVDISKYIDLYSTQLDTGAVVYFHNLQEGVRLAAGGHLEATGYVSVKSLEKALTEAVRATEALAQDALAKQKAEYEAIIKALKG